MDCFSSETGKMGLKKLNGENYHTWKFNMELLLQGKDLWDYVDGSETLVAEATDEMKKKWKKCDNQARSIICLSVQENVQIYVRSSKTSKEAWDSLSKHFQEKTLSTIIHWCRKLYSARMSNAAGMEAHLNNIKTISYHLEALDDAVVEKDLVMILISSLPESYDNLITTLETLKHEQLTWTYVRDRCMAEYARKTKKNDEKKRDGALLAGGYNGAGHGGNMGNSSSRGRFNNNNKFANSYTSKGKFGGKGKSEIECHYCKKKGHIRRECAEWLERDGNAKFTAEKSTDDMIVFGADFALSAVSVDDSENSVCVEEYVNPQVADTEHVEVKYVSAENCDTHDVPVKYCAPPVKDMEPTFSAEFALKVGDSNSVGDVWWVDSGATQHMSPGRKEFESYTEFDQKLKVNLADNSFMLAHGKGIVNLRLYDTNRKVDVTLENTLYVPDIKNRLFSISSAVENGGWISLNKSGVVLNKNGKSAKIGHKH